MNIKKLTVSGLPEVLRHIPGPPRHLYVTGSALPGLLAKPRVAIVGSRKMTAYGRHVTDRLATDLARRGIVIVSGLAYGVDARAHQSALDAGGLAIAVLPGPLDNIVPAANQPLARRILEQSGALVSEYAPGEPPYKQNFVARNRLVSGLADALLITEAGEKSGSLHTARFALEQGRDVLAVPGDITSPASIGTNNLLKWGHAAAVTSYRDVLHVLGLEDTAVDQTATGPTNEQEQCLLELLRQGVRDGARLLELSRLSVSEFSQALTMLEIGGLIRPLGADQWSLC
jgi:DNA processing protein